MATHTNPKTSGHAQEVEALWTVHEASAVLRISKKTVYRMAEEGTMPSCKVGGSRRFVPSHVRAWVTDDASGKWTVRA